MSVLKTLRFAVIKLRVELVEKYIKVKVLLLLLLLTFTPAAFSVGEIQSKLWSKLADFKFEDENGQPFNMKSYVGHAAVVTMSYTQCRKTCPFKTFETLENIQKQAESKFKPNSFPEFFILTFDPASDTAVVLKKFREKRKYNNKNWHFVRLPETETKKFAKLLELDGYWRMDNHIFHDYRVYLFKENEDLSQILDWDSSEVDWTNWLKIN